MKKSASARLPGLIVLCVVVMVGVYLAAPFLKRPERPMFSEKFLWRDNIVPRWTWPTLLEDEAGNRCTIDVPLNSILVCKPTSEPRTVGLVNVHGVPGKPYFVATFQSTRIEEMPLWSKSIEFANQRDTAYILSDDLAFEIWRLRPGAALALREECFKANAAGSRIQDFVEFARKNSPIPKPK